MPTKTIEIAGRPITLDARPDRLDLRDLPYRPSVVCLAPIYPGEKDISKLLPRYLGAGLVLDQESEGACTGFGLAAVINYLLWRRSGLKLKSKDKVSPRMLYHLARFYDEWPGEGYEGSSCRGALKGWHRHGVCTDILWPYRDEKGAHFIPPTEGWDNDAIGRPLGVYYRVDRQSVVDIQAAIFDTGAVYVSANVHEGWDVKAKKGAATHRTLPVINASNKGLGGHAFALVGYNDIGFIVQNSWGARWGASGFAVLPYDDWIANGTDAWVMSLGAPVQNLRQRQHFVRTSAGLSSTPTSSGLIGPALARRQTSEMCWTEQEAYWHTIVTGNDGHVLNRLPHVADEKGNVDWVSYEQPLKWFKANARNAPWRIAVYAHGGLNSEGDSIERIRLLGPCFRENGIFPVFTTWKSGWHETFGSMLADGMKNLFGEQIAPRRGLGDILVEASDRALEVFLRGVIGKSIWSEMKENVTRSTEAGRGVDQLAEQLKRLAADSGGKLQVHLVGHSAGSFICGRLLSELQQKNIKIKSCTLYAPACDLKFALDYFKPAIEGNQLARSEFRIHVLSDQLERDDSVGPYQKSLLYLVSRALDRWHKTPLLGLANAYDGARITEEYWHSDTLDLVKQWQKFFWGGSVPKGFAADGKAKASGNLHVLSASQVNVGTRYIKSSHGCFDNDLDVIRPTLKNIFGSNLRRDVIDLDY
jgi:hypothetical protein